MDFKRHLRILNVIVFIVSCCCVPHSTHGHEAVPPTTDTANHKQQNAVPPPRQQEAVIPEKKEAEQVHHPAPAVTEITEMPQQLPNDTKTLDDSAKPVKSEDTILSSPQVPAEGVAVPMPPSGTDGQQQSSQNRLDEGESKESRSISPGGPMEPVTPSGGETVKPGDLGIQDITAPSSENSEPGTQKRIEVVEESLSTADGAGAVPGEKSVPNGATHNGLAGDILKKESKEDIPKEDPTRKEVEKAVEEGGGEIGKTGPAGSPVEEPSGSEPEEKLPSFDEWKQEMLAEQKQAEQAKHAKQGIGNGHVSQPVSGTITKPKLKGASRINYASSSCGAKMIAANAEAKNSGFILTENKDQYMIQPCQAKKWFVVELCEFVSIQSLEVANLELFSSLPESFIVHTSERYPTKEWKTLGTFRARDERAVQSFPVTDDEMFAKYLKVEPLTHYGAEHYCPLTILRVYGTTAVEDYEEAEQAEGGADDEDHPHEEPGNLFATATDTVISLVKTVLSPGDTKSEQLNGVQLNGSAINGSVLNGTATSPGGSQAAPCTPTATTEEGKGKENCIVGKGEPQTPSVSDVTPLVTLIESCPHVVVSISQLIHHCSFCQDVDHPTCYADRASICGYYRATNFVPDTTCARVPHVSASVKVMKLEDGFPSLRLRQQVIKEGPVQDTGSPGDLKVEPAQDAVSTENVSSELAPTDVGHSERAMPGAAPSTVPLEPSLKIDSTYTTPPLKITMSQTTFETHSTEVSSDGATESEGIQTKPTVPVAASCDPALSDCSTMGPNIVQIRPTTTEEATMKSTDPVEEHDSIPPTKHTDNIQASKTVKSPGGEGSAGALGNGGSQDAAGSGSMPVNGHHANGKERVIHAELPPQEPDYDLEKLAPPDDGEPIQKLSSGRRETAFVKLRNRIKELELNLNLSSRYLEELSQRYRRQMENMYPTLNKTIQKLINTSRTAEQRDLRQQSNITELVKRVSSLTQQLHKLSDNFNNLHTQVIERHLFLMMVEGIIFMLLVTWLLNRINQPAGRVRHLTQASTGRAALSEPTVHTALRPAIHNTKPPDKHKKGAQHKVKRRNSIDATPPRPRASSFISKQRSKDDIGLRLSGSDTSLGTEVLAAADAIPANTEFKEITNRKKRKKKQNKLLLSHSSSSIPVSGQSVHAGYSSTHLHNNVGLLFNSKASSHDPSPPHSAASSESGDSGVSQASGSSQHATGKSSQHAAGGSSQHSANNRQSKAVARRSLDLREIPRATAITAGGGGGNTAARKNHKRQRSDCMLHSHIKNCSVTNIGPVETISKASNGKLFSGADTDCMPEQSDMTSWRGWFGGTRK